MPRDDAGRARRADQLGGRAAHPVRARRRADRLPGRAAAARTRGRWTCSWSPPRRKRSTTSPTSRSRPSCGRASSTSTRSPCRTASRPAYGAPPPRSDDRAAARRRVAHHAQHPVAGHDRVHARHRERRQRDHRRDPAPARRQPGRGRGVQVRHRRRASCPHEVPNIIRDVVETLAGEIQRSLDFYLATSGDREIHKVYVSGGTANVQALHEEIAERCQVDVRAARSAARRAARSQDASTRSRCRGAPRRRSSRTASRCARSGSGGRHDSHQPTARSQARRGRAPAAARSSGPSSTCCRASRWGVVLFLVYLNFNSVLEEQHGQERRAAGADRARQGADRQHRRDRGAARQEQAARRGRQRPAGRALRVRRAC